MSASENKPISIRSYHWKVKMVGDGLRAAVLHRDGRDPVSYSRDALVDTIDTIKKNMHSYATKEAYLKHLDMMQVGLREMDK